MFGIELPIITGKYIVLGLLSLIVPVIVVWIWYEVAFWKPIVLIFEDGVAKKRKGRIKYDSKGKHLLLRDGIFSSHELLIQHNKMMINRSPYYLYFRDKQGFLVPVEIHDGKITFQRNPEVEKVLRNMFAASTLEFSSRYHPQNKWVLISAVSIVIVLFGLGIFAAMVLQSFSNMYEKNSQQALQLSKTNELISKQLSIQQKTMNATLVLLNETINSEKRLGLIGTAPIQSNSTGR